MSALTGMLCRLWKCACRSKSEKAADQPNPGDDLKRIQGIGTATENRLYRAGIKTFGQLAQATPDKLREIVGKLGRSADVERWIAEAAKLATES